LELQILGRPGTSDFSRCDYRAAHKKHTAVYGSARTGDCLMVAIKISQCVPFQERHDCRLSTASTNQTHRDKWESNTRATVSLFLCETSTVQGHFLAVA